MNKFKIRASGASQIMGGTIGLTDKKDERRLELMKRQADHNKGVDKVKPLTANMEAELVDLTHQAMNPEPTDGMITAVRNWVIKEKFGRIKAFGSKHTAKGIINEDESIEMIADVLGFGFLEKNEEHFQNDHMTGTPDIIIPGKEVIDVKNSWDLYTFPHFDTEITNMAYFYQLQVYMELTGLDHAKLIYTLTDTPIHLIDSEASRYAWQSGQDPDDAELFEDFHHRMTFQDIEPKDKIRVFDIERDQSVIDEIKARVEMCQELQKTIQF